MSKHYQASLFDDSPTTVVSVVSALGLHKPADKAQAAFQRLLRQVDEARTQLANWSEYRSRYQQRVASELVPLAAEFRSVRCDMVRQLDAYCDQGILKGKHQQLRLKGLLIYMLEELLTEEMDSALDALFKKHRKQSFAEEKAAELLEKRQTLENLFGISLDDIDTSGNLDDLILQVQKKLMDTPTAEDVDAPEGAEPSISPAKKRKNAKQAAAEQKKEAAAKTISQTVREVYRKLASALHPDRETDVGEREKKTEQMQRVNQAYEAGDLLALLNLQLEIEQIDTDHLASLSAERLTHYNQVLREQLAELKAEVEAVTMPFMAVCGWRRKFVPQDVDRSLSTEILRGREALSHAKTDLALLQEPGNLSVFLDNAMAGAPDEADNPLMEIFLDRPPTARATKAAGKKKAPRRG